jgi:hypothetical protein
VGRRLILDTNVLIAYERDQINRAALDDDELAIAAVSVAEYRVGIELADTATRAADRARSTRRDHLGRRRARLHRDDSCPPCPPHRPRPPNRDTSRRTRPRDRRPRSAEQPHRPQLRRQGALRRPPRCTRHRTLISVPCRGPHWVAGESNCEGQRSGAGVLVHARAMLDTLKGHRPIPGERSCLSLVWAVLDRASRGWRGVGHEPRQRPPAPTAARRLVPSTRSVTRADKRPARNHPSHRVTSPLRNRAQLLFHQRWDATRSECRQVQVVDDDRPADPVATRGQRALAD